MDRLIGSSGSVMSAASAFFRISGSIFSGCSISSKVGPKIKSLYSRKPTQGEEFFFFSFGSRWGRGGALFSIKKKKKYGYSIDLIIIFTHVHRVPQMTFGE